MFCLVGMIRRGHLSTGWTTLELSKELQRELMGILVKNAYLSAFLSVFSSSYAAYFVGGLLDNMWKPVSLLSRKRNLNCTNLGSDSGRSSRNREVCNQ